jgi:thiol-disulfide isomerase/thioredoxin
MTPSPDREKSTPKQKTDRPFYRRFRFLPVAFLLGAMAGLAVVYGIGGFGRNAEVAAACRPAAELAVKLTPLARGEVAALAPAKTPIRLESLTFRDAENRERRIADWSGRVVLLNLWATWCVPCRKEMPALDALQARLGGPDFEVVAVNIDTRDPEKPRSWLKETGVTGLAYYADASAKIFQDLKAAGRAFGMPTTILIDPQGCELATLAGPAEWASEDALAFIGAALKR